MSASDSVSSRVASGGLHVHFISIDISIDERKRAEKHRELLIGELNHRVKNALRMGESVDRSS
jgi:hypothetical protein